MNSNELCETDLRNTVRGMGPLRGDERSVAAKMIMHMYDMGIREAYDAIKAYGCFAPPDDFETAAARIQATLTDHNSFIEAAHHLVKTCDATGLEAILALGGIDKYNTLVD